MLRGSTVVGYEWVTEEEIEKDLEPRRHYMPGFYENPRGEQFNRVTRGLARRFAAKHSGVEVRP